MLQFPSSAAQTEPAVRVASFLEVFRQARAEPRVARVAASPLPRQLPRPVTQAVDLLPVRHQPRHHSVSLDSLVELQDRDRARAWALPRRPVAVLATSTSETGSHTSPVGDKTPSQDARHHSSYRDR
ncbi:MAG: hypothetical protein ACYTFQ_19745 [Planctomycetota bacterium]